ncbi:rRNA methyltransferase 3, mitochondrial-like isoform X1 [Haliotis rufescens]|uniref:rRNA methyltransferase 3, mitochondrial-like isoform X1 n=1 Tax=Haliotis rufescens TaxID=6454 RepID=UPI00201F465C|nr:rRNA methyltransferase 3, mitochondrial-like isoform X1 [Haliotis rufescens]
MSASMASRFCQRSLQMVTGIKGIRSEFQIRSYARGTRRGAQGVFTVDEERNKWKNKMTFGSPRNNPYVPFESQDPVQRSFVDRHSDILRPRVIKKPRRVVSSANKNDDNETLETSTKRKLPKYEKLTEGDKRFGQVILAAKSGKEREKKKVVLLEGFRLIRDAIDSGASAKCIYFSDTDFLDRLGAVRLGNMALYKVQYRDIKSWSDTHTPAGIMAIFEKPNQGECPSPQATKLPLTLICDNVRDPGNMGTLIRTASAVGCHRVLTTKGCVDVWEPKVIRAGMGSHFHIPILSSIPWELLINYVRDDDDVFIAETAKQEKVQAKRKAFTPDDFEQLSEEGTYKISESKMADYREKYGSLMEDGVLDIHEEYLHSDHVRHFAHAPMSFVDYDHLTCSKDGVTVIIGGETTGVSAAARKFAYDRYGQSVTIPMSPTVDSLNAAVAGSVILYKVHHLLASKRK